MKKLFLVLLLFSLTVSCSKDEDEKVDTSTFTGLYNDTVWVIDKIIPDFMVQKDVMYFKDDAIYFGSIDYLDYAPDCFKYTNEFSESVNWQAGTENETEIIYRINTPERLVLTTSELLGKIEVVKFLIENGNLFVDYGEVDGEFDIDNVDWDEYPETYKPSTDYSWKDYLAFECDRTEYLD